MIGSQTSSTSSASGPTKPSARWATAVISAAKKRLSKRRGRRGGVMARPTKWTALRSGMIPACAKACQGPAGATTSHCGRAEHQPGFLVGFADGGERVAGSLDFARPLHPQHQAFGISHVERCRRRHQPIGGLNAAARKNEFAGKKFVTFVAAAEQNLRHAFGAIDQNERRRVPRPQIGERAIARGASQPVGAIALLITSHRTGTVVTHEFLPRGPRRSVCRPPFRCCCGRCLARSLVVGASRISRKRNAPATGAASTSSTVTASPSR